MCIKLWKSPLIMLLSPSITFTILWSTYHGHQLVHVLSLLSFLNAICLLYLLITYLQTFCPSFSIWQITDLAQSLCSGHFLFPECFLQNVVLTSLFLFSHHLKIFYREVFFNTVHKFENLFPYNWFSCSVQFTTSSQSIPVWICV